MLRNPGLLAVLTLALPAASPAFAQPAQPTPRHATPAEDAAFTAWVTANATPISAAGPTEADLAPIVARLAGASIVGIGEATHGTHEDQAFKAELIKALVRSGQVRLLLMEGNLAPNARLDGYVRAGIGDPADALRDLSQFRNVKGDEFAGPLLWLRAWNLSHPTDMVRIAGFDAQDSGRDADTALTYLAPRDAALTARLRRVFQPILRQAPDRPHPRFPQWMQDASPAARAALLPAAAELLAWFDSHASGAEAQSPDFILAHDAARAAVDGLNIYEHGVSPPQGVNAAEYFARRDKAMARTARRMQQRAGKGAVIWAHDQHVLDRLDPGFAAASGYRSLGMELEDALGAAYRSIGFSFTDAIVRTTPARPNEPMAQVRVNDQLVPLPNSGPDTVGSLFAAALPGRQAAWIDMDRLRAEASLAGFRSAWKFWPSEGWFVYPDRWQRDFANSAFVWTAGFDIVVWHRQPTPQRRWPELPRQPDLRTVD